MARKISILRIETSHDPADHDATGFVAHFVHFDSTKTHDRVKGQLDVTSSVTATDVFQGTGGVIDDVVAACKAEINSAGYKDGQYQSESWDN